MRFINLGRGIRPKMQALSLASWSGPVNFSEMCQSGGHHCFENILADGDVEKISEKQEQFNQSRKTKIYNQWEFLLERLRY